METPARHQSRQALHELQRLHDDMGGAVFVRTLQLQYDLAGAVTLEPFVGDGRPGDIAAELIEFFTLIGAPAHRRMEAKAVRVDTQLWGWTAWFCSAGFASSALSAQRVGLAQYDKCMRRPAATAGRHWYPFRRGSSLWFFDENPPGASMCAWYA